MQIDCFKIENYCHSKKENNGRKDVFLINLKEKTKKKVIFKNNNFKKKISFSMFT